MSSGLTGRIERGSREGAVAVATPPEGNSDDDLLGRFLGDDEAAAEAAFAALVDRHGPMVLGVCRHLLGQVSDADDAFQATFLGIWARRGGGDPKPPGARELAVRSGVSDLCPDEGKAPPAGARSKRRREPCRPWKTAPARDPAWDELMPVLHDEVSRLPEKYRCAPWSSAISKGGRTRRRSSAP